MGLELAVDNGDGDADEPEEGGDDGGEPLSSYTCEDCGHDQFVLSQWRGSPMVVCTYCDKPQDYVVWIGVKEE